MGLLDKFFNSESDEPDWEKIQGIIKPSEQIDVNAKDIFGEYESFLIDEREPNLVKMRDPSKAIDAIHWDGLTQVARDTLSKQGFYKKADENDDHNKIIIEA